MERYSDRMGACLLSIPIQDAVYEQLGPAVVAAAAENTEVIVAVEFDTVCDGDIHKHNKLWM